MNTEHGTELLPLTRAYLDQALPNGVAADCPDLFIVQHLLDDTEAFIYLLGRKGFRIRSIVGIEYSAKPDVCDRLRASGLDVTVPRFDTMEAEVCNRLSQVLNSTEENRLLIHEVGGYCAPFLGNATKGEEERIKGIVEETKQGLWRYGRLGELHIPILQIADSELKSIEARLVGDAVSRVIENDCLELNELVSGTFVGVLGFGDIGSSVAFSLSSKRCVVSCYDPNPIRTIRARVSGFSCPGRHDILSDSKVIVGASGGGSVSYGELSGMLDKVVLVSASSRALEFPVNEIKASALRNERVSSCVEEFTMPWGRRIRVVSLGFPVNFRAKSLPLSFADLLFCQVAAGLVAILGGAMRNGLSRLSDEEQRRIAELWLVQYP